MDALSVSLKLVSLENFCVKVQLTVASSVEVTVEVNGVTGRQEQALETEEMKAESAVAVPLASATLMKWATSPASDLPIAGSRFFLAEAVAVIVVTGVVWIVLVVVVTMVV
jgi:hypothetical protein